MLTDNEKNRYDRQIMIPELGETGQAKLKNASVFIAGAGGLGSPVALYLAAAGIGRIRIVDQDQVDESNLNRQILHWDENLGADKVASGCEKLRKLNPHIVVEGFCETIDESNVQKMADGFDLIVDAMDNMDVRYLLNKTAVDKKIPFFHGAINGLDGRAMTVLPGKSACLMCTYRGPVPAEKFSALGTTPGMIGCIQATEVIKYITGMGDLLLNRILMVDGMSMKFREFKIKRNPQCSHCGGVT